MLPTGSRNEQLVSSWWQGLREVLKRLSFLGSRWRKTVTRGHIFAKYNPVLGSFHLVLLPVHHEMNLYAVAAIVLPSQTQKQCDQLKSPKWRAKLNPPSLEAVPGLLSHRHAF